jgi:hypothetical protein
MRKMKKVMALVLAGVMTLSISTTAFAAEENPEEPAIVSVAEDDASESGISSRTTVYHIVGPNYVNMTGDDLRSPHGNGRFYYQVVGEGYNGWVYQINCLMYDANGSVVWRGDNICGIAADGKLEYGGNVVRIDLQIVPRLAVTASNYWRVRAAY